jgi:DNA-binding GntR family transcriptional regulator
MKNPSKSALDQIRQRRSKTLATIVREGIEALVMSGELGVGDRVNESNLAGKFGVSRGPIREACRSLEQAGLLVASANQGSYVREMNLQEACDLYEVRGALSGLIGRLAVERCSDENINDLLVLVTQMDVSVAAQDFDKYYAQNLMFHNEMVKAAGNKSLSENYNSIIKQLHLFRRRGLVSAGSLEVSNAEHWAIVNALKARDSDGTEHAMRNHVAGGWARMSATI